MLFTLNATKVRADEVLDRGVTGAENEFVDHQAKLRVQLGKVESAWSVEP